MSVGRGGVEADWGLYTLMTRQPRVVVGDVLCRQQCSLLSEGERRKYSMCQLWSRILGQTAHRNRLHERLWNRLIYIYDDCHSGFESRDGVDPIVCFKKPMDSDNVADDYVRGRAVLDEDLQAFLGRTGWIYGNAQSQFARLTLKSIWVHYGIPSNWPQAPEFHHKDPILPEFLTVPALARKVRGSVGL